MQKTSQKTSRHATENIKNMNEYLDDAVSLLRRLISTPSVSRDEKAAADVMEQHIKDCGLTPERSGNNIWILSKDWDSSKPTLLLNAHIDTVKPVSSWSRDPFSPDIESGTLYGLGSNDCGGGLVSLLETFRRLSLSRQSYNYVYLASCEEEVSGSGGISSVLGLLPEIDTAIVGEPTGMQPAIAEKGLMVLDLVSQGKSGHAARNEGINAIYLMLDDLVWIRDYKFKKESSLLGPTKMTVTVINAGTQHNVIPDECRALIDVRTNEHYTNEEVCRFIQSNVKSTVRAHSYRLQSSHISAGHPLIRRCKAMGMTPYGSPTLSDQSLMPFPSFKLGPGESSRSHSANEFIRISEIADALDTYAALLDGKDIAD